MVGAGDRLHLPLVVRQSEGVEEAEALIERDIFVGFAMNDQRGDLICAAAR